MGKDMHHGKGHVPQREQKQKKLTLDVLLQNIVNNWVNILIDIFEKEWEAIFNGHFKLFQEVWLIEIGYAKIIGFLLLTNPIDGLLLWINTQREPACIGRQNTILDRELIWR